MRFNHVEVEGGHAVEQGLGLPKPNLCLRAITQAETKGFGRRLGATLFSSYLTTRVDENGNSIARTFSGVKRMFYR
jgi:hypothetical protein